MEIGTEAAARLRAAREKYWRANLRVMGVLLGVWAAAGFGAGILFADRLNELTLPGTHFPLGFWFAHQGAIVVFVLVILAYCVVMNRLDAEHHREVEAARGEADAGGGLDSARESRRGGGAGPALPEGRGGGTSPALPDEGRRKAAGDQGGGSNAEVRR